MAALASPFGLAWLLLQAGSPAQYAGAAIFGAGSLLLFATSACYHVAPWPERIRHVLQRVDHSMIFVAIAATYTPFCLVVLPPAWGIPLLGLVWVLAAAGIVLTSAWPAAPRAVRVAAYLALGWVGLAAIHQLPGLVSAPALGLLLLGGVVYSAGAIVYAARWPNPFPRYFGFHEVFHVLVALGSVAMYAVIATEVVGA